MLTIENGIEGVKEVFLSQACSFYTFTYGDFFLGGGCNTKCGVHVALARLISFLHGSLDMKSIILGKYHYVLHFLILVMHAFFCLLSLEEMSRPNLSC
jgi:hypothetical protein